MAPLHPSTGALSWMAAGLRLPPLGSWLADSFLAERARWALWAPVLFGAGILLYFALPMEPPGWAGAACFATALLAALALRRRPGAVLTALAAVLVAAGFGAAQLRTYLVAAPVLERQTAAVRVEGRVLLAERRADGQRLVLDRLAIGRVAREATPATVRISLRQQEPVFRPGDLVRIRAVLHPPPGPAAPGAYDFARRAWFDRLGGVGYAVGRAERTGSAPDGFAVALESLRQGITERIHAVLPGATGGMAAALMTGDRGAITDEVNEAMQNSGLAHLISISGLHMGLVAGLLFFVIRFGMAALERPALRWPVKKWAAAATLLGTFCYLLISGNTPPTQRSFLMLALVMIAVMIDRQPISMNLVAWAAGAILLLTPESLLNVSFQMSFAAVIALVAAYETTAKRMAGGGGRRHVWFRPLLYLGSVTLSSVVATLATLPFSVYHFNRIAFYGVLANLIAVPLTGFWVMPCAVLAFLLMPFGWEGPALAMMGQGVDAVIAVARWIDSLPGAVALLPAMPQAGFLLAAAGGLWLCLWQGRWRLIGLMPVAASAAMLLFVQPPDMLVDGQGRLFAVRAPDGRLALSTARGGMTGETWLRRSAQEEAERLPRGPGTDWIGCDRLGCIYRAAGHSVALLRAPDALAEDCARADVLIIGSVGVRRGTCPGPRIVIDRWRLAREGPVALWLEPKGVRIETVRDDRGTRPWTGPPERQRRGYTR